MDKAQQERRLTDVQKSSVSKWVEDPEFTKIQEDWTQSARIAVSAICISDLEAYGDMMLCK